MKQSYVPKKFSTSSMEMIAHANGIIDEYQASGFTLTLRQLYYQFVSRSLLPNKQSEYKRLGSVINDARLAGLIDWAAMEDRTRNLRATSMWNSPKEILEVAASQYKSNPWIVQDTYCEVWIEKDALVGVIEGVCSEFRVPYFACRGYSSQSEQYEAGQRLRNKALQGMEVVIFHLGDHDPSGIDMSRDNEDRIRMFMRGESSKFDLRRLALNMNQVEQYGPPPNPAKSTDSRYAGYLDQYGDESWELDALDPTTISDLIRENIKSVIDQHLWDEAIDKEQLDLAKLQKMVKSFK